VSKEDVLRHLEDVERAAAAEATATPSKSHVGSSTDRVEPMSMMRQRISDHMLLSRRTSAHVTTIFEVDMTVVREKKSALSQRYAKEYGVRLTYLPFVLYSVSLGLRKYPVLNASLEGKNVRFHGHVNLGVAVALDAGLIVPVIREAERKNLAELAMATFDLARRARSKELLPEEVQGGTFTITNPGVFGSVIGTPIIHQPQVGILCLGAIQKRPTVLAGTDAIAIRSLAYLSLTFDHRLVDGAVADIFLADVKSTLESGQSWEAA
jgi:2-oxoglutarate dehydrogenase E2 component (dihydrolipoamide succinyltransferase)